MSLFEPVCLVTSVFAAPYNLFWFLDVIRSCVCMDFIGSTIARAKSFACANYRTRSILTMTRPVYVTVV